MEPSTMATDWIEAVLRMNEAIVTAEARLTAQVSDLLTMAMQGQDTAGAETLLLSYTLSLVLLRTNQTQLLQEPETEG